MSEAAKPGPAGRQRVLSLTIKDKSALYAAYMGFVHNGGLFVPTTQHYRLGDEVFILLSLMEEPAKLPVAGRVIWITPPNAQGYRSSGIGVQFNEREGGSVRDKIETYLAGSLESERPTHTL